MAVTVTQTCDFPGECPNEAPLKVEMVIGEIIYRADICTEHELPMVELLEETFNFRPVAAWVDGRRRDAHEALSGALFTTADVRAWAIENGLRDSTAQGRVSNAQIAQYAAEH